MKRISQRLDQLEKKSPGRQPILRFYFYNPATDKNEDDIIDSAAIMIQTIEHFAPAHWFKGKEAEAITNNLTMDEIMKLNKPKDGGWGWQLVS